MGGQRHVPAVWPLASKLCTHRAGGLVKDIRGHYKLWPVQSYGVRHCKCCSRIVRYITNSHSSPYLKQTRREDVSLHVKKEFGKRTGVAELIVISVLNECNRSTSRPGHLKVVAKASAIHFRRDESNMGKGLEYLEACQATHV